MDDKERAALHVQRDAVEEMEKLLFKFQELAFLAGAEKIEVDTSRFPAMTLLHLPKEMVKALESWRRQILEALKWVQCPHCGEMHRRA